MFVYYYSDEAISLDTTEYNITTDGFFVYKIYQYKRDISQLPGGVINDVDQSNDNI